MTQRLNFTKAAIDALPLPEKGKRALYYDTKVGGLALRVTSAGGKSFYIYRRVEGQPTFIRIGPYPAFTIEEARLRAQEAAVAIAHNQNPARAVRASRHEWTFGQLCEWWLADAKRRKKSWEYDESLIRINLAPLTNRRLSSITRGELRALHAELTIKRKLDDGSERGGATVANRAIRLVKAMYARAIAHEVYEGNNPALGLEQNRERSRDRRLTLAELPKFFEALDNEPNEDIRDYILLSLYTGARQANVLAMRWEQVDLVNRTWRIPETKNGMPQILPLEEAELAILRRRRAAEKSPWVFPSRRASKAGHLVEPKSGWRRILKRAGLQDLRIHDLRRTLGSFMVDTGASLHVVGKTLGHQSSAATQIYARLSLDPVREAKARALEAMTDAHRRSQQSAATPL